MNTDILVKIAEICGMERTFCCDAYHAFLVDSASTMIAFRKKYRLRQRELADMMGVAHTTVKRWESSVCRMSKDKYLLFAELLKSSNVPLDEYQEFILAGPALIIKQFRKERRISQAEFAGLLGCSVSTVKFWEQNRNKPNRKSFEMLTTLFTTK